MGKRPDTIETVMLALELLKRIPRRQRVSASELHLQLADAGVMRDLRTIQRQLDMLAKHFDIERDERSKPFGYRWKELSPGLSIPRLNEQESLLLALVEQQSKSLLPAHLMKSMAPFFAQARANLGPRSNAKLERQWLSKIRVVSETQQLLPPKVQAGVFEVVSQALYANFWLHLVYTNAAGIESKIEVMPLGLAQQGPRLYLVCRYRDFDNERSLALHRIGSAKASTLHFQRPSTFDLATYEDEGRFGFGDGQKVQLSFSIRQDEGQHLLESPLSLDQEITRSAGWLDVTATVVDSQQLDWWLRGFGTAIRSIKKHQRPRTPLE